MMKLLILTLVFVSTTATAYENAEVMVQGSYNVPVPAELRAEASFETTYCLTYDEAGTLTKIVYTLPDFLAPDGQRMIELSNPQPSSLGFTEFSGDHGLAACSLRSDSLVCLVSYPTIFYDLEDHIRELLNRHPAEVVERKKGVVEVFAHDPEGIVEIYDL